MAAAKRAIIVSRPMQVPANFSRPAPITINVPRQQSLAKAAHKKPVKHRRKAKAHGAGDIVGPIMGGYVLGYLDKGSIPIPTIPMLGRAGTIGLAAWFLNKHSPSDLARNVAIAALSVAAYEMGKDGKISGTDE